MSDDSNWLAEQTDSVWNSQSFSLSTEPGIALGNCLVRGRDALDAIIVKLLDRTATASDTPCRIDPVVTANGLRREVLWNRRPYTLRVNVSQILGMEVILQVKGGAVETRSVHESRVAKGPIRVLNTALAPEFEPLRSQIIDAFERLVVLGNEWLGRCFREWDGVFAPHLIDNLYQQVRDLFSGSAAAAALEVFIFLWHHREGGIYVLDRQSVEHALRRCSGSPFAWDEGGYGVAHTMAVTHVLPDALFPLDRQPRKCALSDAPYLASGLQLLEMALFRDRHAAGQTIATGGGFTAEAWYPWERVAEISPVLAAPNRIGEYLAAESQRMGEQLWEWIQARGKLNDLSDDSAATQAAWDLFSRRHYAVAISCAGGAHSWFQQLVEAIRTQLGPNAVFYYRDEDSPESRIQANGSRGLELLRQIYRKSELMVAFFAPGYQGDACSTEYREITRRLEEPVPGRGILLYRFDDSRPLGITRSDLVQRVDYSAETAKSVAQEIAAKLRQLRRAR